jgi:electron transfer flavoprotein alpha subunit
VTLFTNPFDARALRVALDLRRAEEMVTAVSMGPPAAAAALREALALGVDRAVLVSDPALAGSDTLVTARTLARALSRAQAELILCGRNSTDSDTGQVGAQVAGILGIPFLSSARRIERDLEGNGLTVTSDTEVGWAIYRATTPAVVAVDEKIVRIQKPTPERLAEVSSRSIETIAAADLGLDSEAIGLGGSPTVVEEVADEEPHRIPEIFSAGSISDRLARAAGVLSDRLGGITSHTPPHAPSLERREDEREVLLHVTDEEGALFPPALPVVTATRRLGSGYWPTALWVGPEPPPEGLDALAKAGVAGVVHVALPSPTAPARSAALAISRVLQIRPHAAAVVFLATFYGRSVAGQLSGMTGLGLVGDAIGIGVSSGGELLWRKPSFGGGVVASISTRTRPSVATVRPGSMPPGAVADVPREGLSIRRIDPPLSAPETERIGRAQERLDSDFGDLDTARVVVCIGMGLGGPENIPRLRPLIRKWRAALAATRRVVDAGWVPPQLQVGLTGRSLAPDLVLLLGINGAPNHMVGWRRAKVIAGVNPNPEAPLFRGVDIGIVAPWEEALPHLGAAWEPTLRAVGLVTG